MAYDEDLAHRIRELLQGVPGLTEQRMFGGLAFLVHGNMSVACGRGGLLLRVDRADTDALVGEPHVRRAEMQGRTMNGWIRVGDAAIDDERDLRRWVELGVAYASSLPPKR